MPEPSEMHDVLLSSRTHPLDGESHSTGLADVAPANTQADQTKLLSVRSGSMDGNVATDSSARSMVNNKQDKSSEAKARNPIADLPKTVITMPKIDLRQPD
jgi:hypothetical protein